MKTRFPRLSSVLAALLLSCGFVRAAQAFDVIALNQPASACAAEAAAQCTSACYQPDLR